MSYGLFSINVPHRGYVRPFALVEELFPVDTVPAWEGRRSGLELHWYGLTYGTYQMLADEKDVYELRGASEPVYFAVARLWSDLVEIIPSVLDTIPEFLAARLTNVDEWERWATKAFELDGYDDAKKVATEWWYARQMEALHFDAPPIVSMWRTGENIRVSWRPNPGAEDIWANPRADTVVRTEEFLDELLAFDRRLMASMSKRIDDIEHHWNRPDVHIDLAELRRDHCTRCRALEAALHLPLQRRHSWAEIQEAVSTIDLALQPSLRSL